MLGVEAVEEDQAGSDGDAGKSEEAAAFLEEAAGAAALLPFLGRGYAIVKDGGELGFVERLGDSFGEAGAATATAGRRRGWGGGRL
jgi:hypothetical protein